MIPNTGNTQGNPRPIHTNESGNEQRGNQDGRYFGSLIRAIRSCSAYIMPSTQEIDPTERRPSEAEPQSTGFSFIQALRNSISEYVFHPENQMRVNREPEPIRNHPFQTPSEAFYYYLNETNQLLSMTSFWNFISSLNPHYTAPRNANLREMEELAAPQNAFSIGHFVALICTQVSTRSTLPPEMHWLLEGVANYVFVCTNIKTVQDLCASFKEKYNATLQERGPLQPENDNPVNPVNDHSLKIQLLNEKVNILSEALLILISIVTENATENRENAVNLLLAISDALITETERLEAIKIQTQKNSDENRTAYQQNEREEVASDMVTSLQYQEIEEQLDLLGQNLIDFKSNYLPEEALNMPPSVQGRGEGAISGEQADESFDDMPELEE